MAYNLNSLTSIDSYQKALQFASEAHAGQCVPGTKLPYLLHLTSVAFEVLTAVYQRDDVDRDLAVHCALLHDVLEDTSKTYEEIVGLFGKKVAAGVLALTKDASIEKPGRMKNSLQRIKKQPVEIWMVKMADRIVNLNPPPKCWDSERISAYRREAGLIHGQLQKADNYLADRLAVKIMEYEKYLK